VYWRFGFVFSLMVSGRLGLWWIRILMFVHLTLSLNSKLFVWIVELESETDLFMDL